MNTANLNGLVLSGGESRRMGQDKGLISSDSVAWVNQVGAILQSQNLPVSVMIREAQRAVYESKILPGFELLTDLDLPAGGPLKGLLSFHRYYPLLDVLALPADMPDLTPEVVRELCEFYESKPGADAWVYKVGGFVQPFPGIYSYRLLASTLARLHEQEIKQFGLLNLLESVDTAIKEFEGSSAIFKNYNRPQDLTT